MSDREKILSAVKTALKDLPAQKRTAYPEWKESLVRSNRAPAEELKTDPEALWAVFKERFSAVHGDPIDSLNDVPLFLKERECSRGFVDPGLVPFLERAMNNSPAKIEIMTHFDRAQVDHYDFGITRAEGLIAETGTIILKDRLTASRLGVLAPWLHLALVPADNIYPTVAEAITAFDNDPYITFATGPSKTADIEGILIEGVHGPGIQAVCRF